MSGPARQALIPITALLFVAAALFIAFGPGGGDQARPRARVENERGAPDAALRQPGGERLERASAGAADDGAPEAAPVAAPASPGADAGAAPPLRGVVLDRVTRAPVPDALVEAGPHRVPVDGQGRFDAGVELPADVETIRVHDPFQGTHIRDIRRAAFEFEDDGSLVLPIDVGPSFRFRIAGDEPVDRWRVRVVERSPGRADRAWSWARPRPGPVPWIRYDNPQPVSFDDGELRLEVERVDGLRRGWVALDAAAQVRVLERFGDVPVYFGEHPEVPLIVPDEDLARVTGLVLRSNGRDNEGGIDVVAVPIDVGGTLSDQDARRESFQHVEGTLGVVFELSGLRPGAWWIEVRSRLDGARAERRVQVAAGESRLSDTFLPPLVETGSIRGTLASEDGRDMSGTIVRLRRLAGPAAGGGEVRVERARRPSRVPLMDPALRGAGDGPARFQFTDLPLGEYELSVAVFDPRLVAPEPLRVRAPADDLALLCRRPLAEVELALRVLADGTGEELSVYRVEGRSESMGFGRAHETGPSPRLARIAEGLDFELTVFAEGYRPERFGPERFVDEGGKRVATVRLRPGWGIRYRFARARGGADAIGGDWVAEAIRGAVAAPVEGVGVRVDGRLAGRSDARGELLLEGASPPAEVRFEPPPGWWFFGSSESHGARPPRGEAEVLVWLYRQG